jgi:diacylglycerol kinase family enzyme
MDEVLIFANPIAGRGKGKAAAEELRRGLAQMGFGVELFTKKGESAAWDPGGKRIVAAVVIGGDGTLRGVAQLAIDHGQRFGKDPYPLLIVPMGTANLMGKHLGLSWDHEHLSEQVGRTLREHRVVELDVATTQGGIFLLMAGIGFDAWVVHELDRIREGPIDYTKYVLPAIRAVQQYRFPAIRVTVDGKRVFSNAPGLALVGNVREYGTGFALLPQARSDDGLLDVCVMPCASRRELAGLILAAAGGEHLKQEGVVYVKGKKVLIESAEPVPVQVDGEPAGQTPLEIGLLPRRIPFMVPA